MLQQHQPFDRLDFLEDLRGLLGEQKARHDVGHDAQPAPVKIGAAFGGIGLICKAQHRGRVRMVDEFVR